MDTQLDLRQTLNEKEKCIYELLCNNLCNKEIAEIVGLTTDGVVYYLRIIYRKLGLFNSLDTKLIKRQKAISYSGTRVVETVFVKNSDFYTREEIFSAMKSVTWQDANRMQEIVTDILSVLESERESKRVG